MRRDTEAVKKFVESDTFEKLMERDRKGREMTRLEENGMVINKMNKRAELKPTGIYEEMVTFRLGTIATMLADISKSLAILADKAESEVEE